MLGFYRFAAVVPKLRVADVAGNTAIIAGEFAAAARDGAAAVVFPELAVTGYSCGDLFEQRLLLDAARRAADELARFSSGFDTVMIVGLPFEVDDRLYNAAAVIQRGRVLGLAAKSYLPNYREYYEKRHFRSAFEHDGRAVEFNGVEIPFGGGLLFSGGGFRFGVEICEDLWAVEPPSGKLALAGAQVIFNLSAGTELVDKARFRRELVLSQSARISGVYLLAGAGVHESTSEAVFSGHALIAANGRLLAQTPRFQRESMRISADLKPEWFTALRRGRTSFNDGKPPSVRRIEFSSVPEISDLSRVELSRRPFVPELAPDRAARCEEIISIQSAALAGRVEHTRAKRLVIGVSGGLDSTLAMLVAARSCELLNLSGATVLAVTMPGFGTGERTLRNACSLAERLGAELRKIPIRRAVLRHFADIGHDSDKTDVVYENSQARERTQILMDIANAEDGLVVGTGDLSESALGWSTFNGDQMSMYAVNASVPKTLVRFLVGHFADSAPPETAVLLRDICATPVSPELLPGGAQFTEDVLGSYELHDFFLYYFLNFGETPEGLLALGCRAFAGIYPPEETEKALTVFLRRFFASQFKRNAFPDGPKVGGVSLSPRADWRMVSDVSAELWSNIPGGKY